MVTTNGCKSLGGALLATWTVPGRPRTCTDQRETPSMLHTQRIVDARVGVVLRSASLEIIGVRKVDPSATLGAGAPNAEALLPGTRPGKLAANLHGAEGHSGRTWNHETAMT